MESRETSQRAVLTVIASRALHSAHGVARVSFTVIAAHSEVSRPTVIRAVETLLRRGLLVIVERARMAGPRSHAYSLPPAAALWLAAGPAQQGAAA